MADRKASGGPGDIAAEEFLFHLYRGSELLSDNRVHEAKEELESALRLQPLDGKGQDLLANVYFRLGMYPRAIAIFETLARAYPRERTLRVNLALCFLKTGQPQSAREILEKTVQQHPDAARAWGYLGLAYERLGDYLKAREAFLRAGQDGMAKRMDEAMRDAAPAWGSMPPPRFEDVPDAQPEGIRPDALAVAPEANEWARRSMPPNRWNSLPPQSLGGQRPSAPPPGAGPVGPHYSVPPPVVARSIAPSAGPSAAEIDAARAALVGEPLDRALRRRAVVPSAARTFSSHASGAIVVSVATSFSCRSSLTRVASTNSGAPFEETVVRRKDRGKEREIPLGGPLSPFVQYAGVGTIVLQGANLVCVTVGSEPLYLREEFLAGFEDGVSVESGRLPVGEGEAVPMVQLSGPGGVLAELGPNVGTFELLPPAAVTMPRECIIGWAGALIPRAVPPSEASGRRGLVSFAGEGFVLVRLT
jgi:Flp pilus assembly protein TadD